MDSSKLETSQLKDAYKIALAAAWTESRAKHPSQTPYAFVVNADDTFSVPHVDPHVLTEEALTEVAERYIEKGLYDELDEARKRLRFSVGDSPHWGELVEHTRVVDDLMEPHRDWLWENGGLAIPIKAAMKALSELDSQGLFGKGRDRERLLLLVSTNTDTSKKWEAFSAERLNPKATFKRFQDYREETKVEGDYASCDGLAISADGASVYTIGSRRVPNQSAPGRQEWSIAELVAYDLREGRLFRRGAFSGNSFRQIACTSNGEVFALRQKISSSLLMRFEPGACQPLRKPFPLDHARWFAVSQDGSQIAVALQDNTLHLMEGHIRLLRRRPRLLCKWTLEARPHRLVFLRSGEVLVATETAVICLAQQDSSMTTYIPGFAVYLSLDATEKLLAVSEFVDREKPIEIGVRLHRLPSRKLLRTFIVPGYHATRGTISPNGRLLAVEANQIGTYRKCVVVFDTVTGQEIARRRQKVAYDLAFLHDNRTLAIAVSGFTKTEPVEFWTMPNLDS